MGGPAPRLSFRSVPTSLHNRQNFAGLKYAHLHRLLRLVHMAYDLCLQQEKCMRTIDRVLEVSPPPLDAKDKEMVRIAQRCIMASLDHSRAAAITLTTDTGEHPTVEVPPAALKLIGQLLGAMSEGRPIVLMPTAQEFTTVEAANFLNVSRPFVIKEIEAGRLPHRKVGTHRRIALEDLLAYAQKMRAQQARALERLADNARELGLDY
jgi:excisionase family DNA binding protein